MASLTPELEQLRIAFLQSYLQLAGVASFMALPRTEKRECLAAWEDEKAALVAGVA